MREIRSEEAYRLYECLESLAKHHNDVSVYFKGLYPTISSEELINSFKKEMEEGKAYIAVVEDEEKVIGFCKISVDCLKGNLDYLAVLKQERGKGYGTALMDWAFNRFRQLQISDIEVKVVYGNDVIDLYKKYGFKEKSIILKLDTDYQ